jgi:hypothetical protein
MNLPAIEDELYGLPLREFTAARDGRATEARKAGKSDVASAVKRLRKPSVAAWITNMLVRERGSEIERLISLGEELRSARGLKGEQIRRATMQRSDAVRTLLRHARAIADRANQPASRAVLDEVEVTLDAAFSDPESAASLRAGRLTTALHYSGLGFGSAPEPGAAAGATRRPVDDTRTAGRSTTTARKALEQATREARAADVEADSAKRAVVTAEADLKRLRAAFAVADRKAKKARQKVTAAQRKFDRLEGPATR